MVPRRRVGMVCAMLYCLAWIYNRDAPEHPYIHYYNRRLCWLTQRPACRRYLVSVEVQRLTVCPPTWRSWRIVGLCGCCILCAGIWQINRNSAVKPCKRFWRFDRINLHGRQKSRCKRLCVANTPPGKRKALHRVDARQKKSPATWAGLNLKLRQR